MSQREALIREELLLVIEEIANSGGSDTDFDTNRRLKREWVKRLGAVRQAILDLPVSHHEEGRGGLREALEQLVAYAKHLPDCTVSGPWISDFEWESVKAAPIGPERQRVWATIEARRPNCTCGLSTLLRGLPPQNDGDVDTRVLGVPDGVHGDLPRPVEGRREG